MAAAQAGLPTGHLTSLYDPSVEPAMLLVLTDAGLFGLRGAR